MSENSQKSYKFTYMAPVLETSIGHACTLCEWLGLSAEGEVGRKDASRAVL